MNDLEKTKLCAEAMELQWRDPDSPRALSHPESALQCLDENEDGCVWKIYDPLHSDGQAGSLLRKFHLNVRYNLYRDGKWSVCSDEHLVGAINDDLNRAIVECVAKMQAAKQDKP